MMPKAVLFDLDGTLVDHFDTIRRSINFAQERLGLPLSNRDDVCRVVGGSISVTLDKLLGKEDAVKARPLYEARFREIWKEDLRVLPGARWILEGLAERGIERAVFTNKHGDAAREVIEYVGLADVAGAVIGTGDTPWRKPQEEFTKELLSRVGSSAEEAVLIGDGPYDAETGRVVGMDVYLVASGSHTREQLRDVPAKVIYDDLYALGSELFGLER